MIKVELDSVSVTGRRSMNQDCAYTYSKPGGICAIAVADGMGGTNGGEIASALTCKAVKEKIESSAHSEEINLKSTIYEVFAEAQKLISLKKLEEPELATLGTTLVCMVIDNTRVAWGNIGDSRLYKITAEKVELLTRDHTLINETFDKIGLVTLEEIASQSHVLTRSIDGGKDQPDLSPLEYDYSLLHGGELFVACSDGAILDKQSNDHSWLSGIATNSGSLKEFLNHIIEYAFSMGSTDNITVAAINYGHIFINQKTTLTNMRGNVSEKKPDSTYNGKDNNKVFRFSLIATSAIFLISLLLIANQRFDLSLLNFGREAEKSSQNPDEINGIPIEKNNISFDQPGVIKGNSDYFDHLQKGNELQRTNQLDRALKEYERARKIDSSDPALNRIINELYEKLQIGPALNEMNKAEEEKAKEVSGKGEKVIEEKKKTEKSESKIISTEPIKGGVKTIPIQAPPSKTDTKENTTVEDKETKQIEETGKEAVNPGEKKNEASEKIEDPIKNKVETVGVPNPNAVSGESPVVPSAETDKK